VISRSSGAAEAANPAEAEAGTAGPLPHLTVGRRSALAKRAIYLWDISVHLVRRDFATRHRGSALGWIWALVPPLLQLLVTYFLFTKVIPLNVPDYPVFLLTGILAWNFFARAMSLSALALEQSRELVLRPGFPIGVLPVKAVLIGLLDYLLALPVLLIALGVTIGLQWTALLLPVLLAIQLVLCIGIGWMLAPFQVFFRDVQYLVALVVMVGFWVTPVFYERTSVPSQYHLLYELNPMAHLIEWQRWIMLDGTRPQATSVLALSGVAIALAVAGWIVFNRLRHAVPEEL
jgi:lipopolysaccharide transport system permease protein